MKQTMLIFALIFNVMLLTGCETIRDSVSGFLQDDNCYRSVAVGKATITEVVTQANLGHEANYINNASYTQIDSLTDRAYAAFNEASSWCAVEEETAQEFIDLGYSLIGQAEPLIAP